MIELVWVDDGIQDVDAFIHAGACSIDGKTCDPLHHVFRAHIEGAGAAECGRKDCQRIADTASEVYCAITGGLLSHPTYDARTILAHYEDDVQKQIDEETAEVRAEVARLRGVVQAVEALHHHDGRLRDGGPRCYHCSRLAGRDIGWPCSSVPLSLPPEALPVPTDSDEPA